MNARLFLPAAVAALSLAGPVSALAADADLSDEEVLEMISEDAVNEAVPAMIDGRGGGGMFYPGPVYGGVTVDASVTKEVTPDFVALSAYCEISSSSREGVRDALNQLYTEIKNVVGTDGRVRKQGAVSVYPMYGPTGEATSRYNGTLSVFIRITKPSAASRISDAVEGKGCGSNWDVRLMDTQSFELGVLDTLVTRLNKRKSVFEKLLGKRLTRVAGATLNTWADGYSTYDPETNKVEATTTLSVSFDLGTRTLLPAPAAEPRG